MLLLFFSPSFLMSLLGPRVFLICDVPFASSFGSSVSKAQANLWGLCCNFFCVKKKGKCDYAQKTKESICCLIFVSFAILCFNHSEGKFRAKRKTPKDTNLPFTSISAHSVILQLERKHSSTWQDVFKI